MNFLDSLLNKAAEIELAKINRPREVQTIEQSETNRRTSVDNATLNTSGVPRGASGIQFAGFDRNILMVTGLVLGGIVLFKAFK